MKQQLRDELKKAMLARDAVKTSVLRMLLSAIQYFEIKKGGAGYEATDEDVLIVIAKEAKQHKDSIEQFSAGGRQDLVDKEKKELEILQAYLPAQMGEEEIRKLVIDAIKQTGASSPNDMGKVMGALMSKVKGKADGGLVSKIVREKLGK
ncbi:GatB/YqeY domain-containing protein [Patescibacteria group bacterium]|nr:GatB/YqeY domain-containing protein [Patescibacteria group bacterium]MBU4016518.1 GatB/YqeY domain-containing protein [Patescibacteria group bacterium]MBU4098952.1 GatB/YqeY domain-containing protein [Patescibacteria group bacterium]